MAQPPSESASVSALGAPSDSVSSAIDGAAMASDHGGARSSDSSGEAAAAAASNSSGGPVTLPLSSVSARSSRIRTRVPRSKQIDWDDFQLSDSEDERNQWRHHSDDDKHTRNRGRANSGTAAATAAAAPAACAAAAAAPIHPTGASKPPLVDPSPELAALLATLPDPHDPLSGGVTKHSRIQVLQRKVERYKARAAAAAAKEARRAAHSQRQSQREEVQRRKAERKAQYAEHKLGTDGDDDEAFGQPHGLQMASAAAARPAAPAAPSQDPAHADAAVKPAAPATSSATANSSTEATSAITPLSQPPGKKARPQTQRKRPSQTQPSPSATAAAATPPVPPVIQRVEVEMPPLYSSDDSDASSSDTEDADATAGLSPSPSPPLPRWAAEWQLLEQQISILTQCSNLHEPILNLTPNESALPATPPFAAQPASVRGAPPSPMAAATSATASASAAPAAGTSPRGVKRPRAPSVDASLPVKLHLSSFAVLQTLLDTAQQAFMRDDETAHAIAGDVDLADAADTHEPSRSAWGWMERVPARALPPSAVASRALTPLPPRQSHPRAARDATIGLYADHDAAALQDLPLEAAMNAAIVNSRT